MKLTISILSVAFAATGWSAEPRPLIKDVVLDDHAIQSIPVSGARVTTITFPSAIAAIDGALVASDLNSPGIFQIAHTAGTSYFSVRALAKGATTNLNVRWKDRTYVFELKETTDPLYVLNLQAPKPPAPPRPLSPPRLLGLLDKAKAFAVLQQHHPAAVAGLERQDFSGKGPVTDCGDYEIQLHEAFRFERDDTLVFRVTIRNKAKRLLTFQPERTQVKVGQLTFTPSVTDIGGIIAPEGTSSGYLAITGGNPATGGRNDLSLKNEFLFLLARASGVDEAVHGFEGITSTEGFAK
jgi:hypothetical protein